MKSVDFKLSWNTLEDEFGELLFAKLSSRKRFGLSPWLYWLLKSLFLIKNLEISIFRSLDYKASQNKNNSTNFDNIIAKYR